MQSRELSFVFQQSGVPFPTRGLIVLVTRRPELSAILEPGGLALLAGDASVDSWFREIHVPQAWRVYLATGLDFREKNRVSFESIGTRLWLQSPTLPLYYEGKMMKAPFPQNYVYVLRTTTTRHMVSFIDFYFHF